MKLNYAISFIIITLQLFSCTSKSALERALDYAGKNRVELEKVLTKYNKNPEDSLKYKAAVFLIENMPGYNFYEGDDLDGFKSIYLQTRISGKNGKEALKIADSISPINISKLMVKADIKQITSEYLINNIEHSFMVWNKQPWGKDVTFNDFCEYILPYRIGNEPWVLSLLLYMFPVICASCFYLI